MSNEFVTELAEHICKITPFHFIGLFSFPIKPDTIVIAVPHESQ